MPNASAELTDDETELLLRQVHPSFVRDGRVGSQAFRPTAKDKRLLSVARGSMTSAEEAFKLHTDCLRLASAGTWGVAVGECTALGLPTRSDPVEEEPCPDPAHAIVDFSELSNSKIEAQGARLARHANDRGRLYPGSEVTAT